MRIIVRVDGKWIDGSRIVGADWRSDVKRFLAAVVARLIEDGFHAKIV